MVHAGIDVVRMNFSHGATDEHVARAEAIRDASARVRRPVGILADLQGPKIRIGKFADGRVTLARDDEFILDSSCPSGNRQRVGLDYKDLPRDVRDGDILLEVSDAVRESLIETMAPAELRAAVEGLDTDELADLAPFAPGGVCYGDLITVTDCSLLCADRAAVLRWVGRKR